MLNDNYFMKLDFFFFCLISSKTVTGDIIGRSSSSLWHFCLAKALLHSPILAFVLFLSQGKSTRWMRTHLWAALMQSMTWAPFRETSASWRTPLPWRKWCSPPSQHPGWHRRSSAWDLPTRPCRPSPPKSERPTTVLPSASERGAGLLTRPSPKVTNVLHAWRHQGTLAVVQLISR